MSYRLLTMLFIVACMAQIFVSPSHAFASTTPQSPITANVAIPATGCTQWYVVRPGDYLSRITANWRAVAVYNHVANGGNLIYVGQRLCLAWSGSSSTAPVSSTSSRLAYEPCSPGNWTANGTAAWTVPPGCLSGVYRGVYWNGRADCFAWVAYVTGGRVSSMPVHGSPRIGAAMWFPPGNQGASSVGHWARVVAIANNGKLLISEQNNYWRGGYGLLTYRIVFGTGYYRY